MPLIGVVDPSHREHASDSLGRLPAWLPLADALGEAADGKWSPWPWELLNAMFGEVQERDRLISASALVNHCTRADIIKRRADYVEDLESLYVPFRGTMVHRTLEQYASPETIAEARFWTSVAGEEISCSPDALTRTTLTDYKVTENPPQYNNPWPNHQEQVQINAFIVRNSTAVQAGITGHERTDDFLVLPFDPREQVAEKLVLVYMGPKKVKSLLVERTIDYFDITKNKDVRGKRPFIWTDEQAMTFLEPRVKLFKRALEAYPDWPGGAEEIWGGDAGWQCPGYPLCKLPNCIAKRYPGRLTWSTT